MFRKIFNRKKSRGQIPLDGLIAWYDFKNVSGATVYNKMGGNDLTIAAHGSVVSAPFGGMALRGDDSIGGGYHAGYFPSSLLNNTDEFTLCFDLYIPTPADAVTRHILDNTDASHTANFHAWLNLVHLLPAFATFGATGSGENSTTYDYITGIANSNYDGKKNWAIVRTGVYQKQYFNGILLNTNIHNYGALFDAPSVNTYIFGTGSPSSVSVGNSYMSNIMIYNKALPDEAIRNIARTVK